MTCFLWRMISTSSSHSSTSLASCMAVFTWTDERAHTQNYACKKEQRCSQKHTSGHVFIAGPELQANSSPAHHLQTWETSQGSTGVGGQKLPVYPELVYWVTFNTLARYKYNNKRRMQPVLLSMGRNHQLLQVSKSSDFHHHTEPSTWWLLLDNQRVRSDFSKWRTDYTGYQVRSSQSWTEVSESAS